MAFASIMNLIRALPHTPKSAGTLVTVPGLGRMATIFVPAVIFVFAAAYIGIYVASAIYIAAFMVFVGHFPWWKALTVSVGVALVSFLMFEVWFLVPLPKGPLEAALGY